ncbi:MAG: hypothetical protein WCF30_18050 [Terracidiphilus sp.]
MSETFRPSTLGEILDRTARLYRRNFWLFAGVAALPIGTVLAFTAAGGALFGAAEVGFRATNLANPAGIALVVLVVLIAAPVYIAAAVFSSAGLTQAAASTNRGEKITIRGAFASVRPRFWRYLWFFILQGIVVAFIPAAIALAVAGPLIYLASRSGAGVGAGAAIGFVVFFIFFAAFFVIVWLVLGYSIGLSVCVVEQKPAWDSLKRAWRLSQGTRGRIFVMYLLVIALSIALSMVAAIPFLIIVAVATSAGNGAAYSTTAVAAAEIVRVIVDFLLQVLLAPISAIALVLFYYDQCIRKEGLDIEWMMQQAGLTQPAYRAPAAADPGISGPVGRPDTVEEP